MSAAPAGSTVTGGRSSILATCRRSAGSSITPVSSIQSRSTPAFIASTFDGWREKAPPGFRYAVKVHRFITHNKKLLDCAEPLGTFCDLARRLGQSLGPLLHQLPPNLRRNDQRLANYLALLPSDLEHVVEFRHSSWYDKEVLALLDQYGVGFVAHDLAGLVSPVWASGRTAYVRFHGTSGKYWGRYSEGVMAGWAEWLTDQQAQGRSAWAYFNNDIHGHALDDARTLKQSLATLASAGR
jgi:uncharacterized protein YecE (DUF72 family)